MRRLIRWSAAFAASCFALVLMSAPPVAAAEPAAEPAAATSARERARVDTLPLPALTWTPCELGECASLEVPLDYDSPRAETITLALTRIPARDPQRRIGSLFVNPGGPGASATALPQRFQQWASAEVLDRFDLIGMDPRGTNASTNTHCFRSAGRATTVTETLVSLEFPATSAQERTFVQAARRVATACANPAEKLASAMSTAQVARDMDVVRRAVGDDKLSYIGFSYGTYLGQVYANLFPDRVRAIVVDGVVDPRAWVGTQATAGVPMSVRMNSAPAASAALAETLQRCADAGGACPLSDPAADFARVADRLRAAPLVVEDPEAGTYSITYQSYIEATLYALYAPEGPNEIPLLTALVDQMQASATSTPRRRSLAVQYRRTTDRLSSLAADYPNTLETVPSVMCSDSLNPWTPRAWHDLAASEDARAPYFGRHFLWGTVYCAQSMWRAQDEDAYTGPFDKVTAEPLMVVGSLHDPATSYAAAQSVASLVPRSRLLTSTNWGHTAYGISACATAHVDRYLLDGRLPPEGTVCDDTPNPFGG